jgi:hypothetical protein
VPQFERCVGRKLATKRIDIQIPGENYGLSRRLHFQCCDPIALGAIRPPERTLNVLKMFAGTEDLCEATIGIVKAMFQAKGVDPRTREMIILRAAKVWNAPYEAQANVVMAKNVGLSAAEIDAAATDGAVSGINPE